MFNLYLLFLALLTANFVGCSYFDQEISDELQCQCVPPHLCADNDESANGQGLLGIRFENDQCPKSGDICCELPLDQPPPKSPPKTCGISKTNKFGARITQDSEKTSIGELPWSVLVITSPPPEDKSSSSICGGSLIHPQVVITAAHCVDKMDHGNLKVRAGEWNIKNKKEPFPHQDQNVKEVLLHSGYKPGTLWNDIALLFLKEPISSKENIGFICLKIGSFKIDEVNCVGSGWGRRNWGRKKMSPVLRKVTLPLVPRIKCQQKLRGSRLGKSFRLHRSFLCAGGIKNKDTCRGDGGSPLICPVIGKDNFVQVGIVSWGIGCGVNDTPGVYINVSLYVSWIETQMKSRNFTSEYFTL